MRNIILTAVAALIFCGCSSTMVGVKETKESKLSDYRYMQFVKGMRGAENIYVDPDSSKLYVTDLSGIIYMLDDGKKGVLKIVKKLKIGDFATGIVSANDGYLYVNASKYGKEGWLKYGGEIYKVARDLKSYEKISGQYPGINGMTITPEGDIFFAAGDLEFFSPDGEIYRMRYDAKTKSYAEPELFLDDLGSANGMLYSKADDTILFTETFSKLSKFDPKTKKISLVLDKTKIVEGFDDLCIDSFGRIWLAEPVGGFLKMYDPSSKKLTRFRIDGVGVASSCDTKKVDGDELIYVTEREINSDNDGRGVIVLSIDELMKR